MQLTVPINKRCVISVEGITDIKVPVYPVWTIEGKGVIDFKITDDGLVGYGYPFSVGTATVTISFEKTKQEPQVVNIEVVDLPDEVVSFSLLAEVVD